MVPDKMMITRRWKIPCCFFNKIKRFYKTWNKIAKFDESCKNEDDPHENINASNGNKNREGVKQTVKC